MPLLANGTFRPVDPRQGRHTREFIYGVDDQPMQWEFQPAGIDPARRPWGNDSLSRDRQILNQYLNSRNMGFSGWRTMVDHNPAGVELLSPGTMAEANQWWAPQPRQSQQGWQYAAAAPYAPPAPGGPTPSPDGYHYRGGFEWGPFKWKGFGFKSGSPFAPDSPGVMDSLFPPAPPAPGPNPMLPYGGSAFSVRPSELLSEIAPAAPPMFAVGGAGGMGGRLPAPSQISGGGNAANPFAFFAPPAPESAPAAPVPYPSPASPVPMNGGYNEWIRNDGQGGYAPNPFPGTQPIVGEADIIDRQRQHDNLDAQWAMRYQPGQLQSRVGSSDPVTAAPLNRLQEGERYQGSSMVITLPNGRQSVIGPRLVQEATQALPTNATPEQRREAVTRYFLESAQRDPGYVGENARSGLGTGSVSVNVGYNDQQRWNMMAAAAQSRGIDPGQYAGDFQGLAGAVNAAAVRDRAERRRAANEARYQQLQEGRAIRRESLLEGRYGDAARRRFAIENEARRKVTMGNLDLLDSNVQSLVTRMTPIDPATGQRGPTDWASVSRSVFDDPKYRNNPGLAWEQFRRAGLNSAQLSELKNSVEGGMFGWGRDTDPAFIEWMNRVHQAASGSPAQPAQVSPAPAQAAPSGSYLPQPMLPVFRRRR